MKKEIKYGFLAAIAGLVAYYLFKLGTYTIERMESPFTYFTWSEFDSPDEPGSGKLYMSEAFITKLDMVRELAGFPFIINSGYRSHAHNAEVGGVPNSSHTVTSTRSKAVAADIAAITEDQKYAIAEAAISQGITRIGWGRTFIHLDIDPDKSQEVVWNYGNSAPTFRELTENLT